MGVWNRIKSWEPELTERVGKVGVWKRLDLALLGGTKGMKAVWGREDAKVERQKDWRGKRKPAWGAGYRPMKWMSGRAV